MERNLTLWRDLDPTLDHWSSTLGCGRKHYRVVIMRVVEMNGIQYIKHWKGNVVILTTFSSLDQRHWKLSFSSPAYDENVGEASDENLTKMTIFSLQWRLNNMAVISQTTLSIIHFLELKMLDMPTGVSNWLRRPRSLGHRVPRRSFMYDKCSSGICLMCEQLRTFIQSPTQNLCHRLIIIHEMCVLHLYQATSNMDANRNIWFVLG